ncbi:MAG TPA: ABC transporter permease [Geminicoccus sp.]|jgi:ribose transport system permease protein|uniref:ABC transporter permease n=1 Tax=Geminicoccus sp. TaxID=2024832 RepID=UPI002E33FE9E|nr:ABC transporter permease [Geminicoccus sp.]HEX2527148.1 ABC transporter permease [Geminicoccus sp.]
MNPATVARLRDVAPILTLILVILIVGIGSKGFLTPETLLVLAADTSTLFIMAAGITFVILLGGIDLSVQSVASMTSVVMAILLPSMGFAAFPAAIAVGACLGLINGLAFTQLKVPSFISSLAVGGIATALALAFSGTRSIPISEDLRADYLGWITGRMLGIPAEIWLGGIVLAICLFLERYTLFGRWSLAVGAGEPAAIASGVPVGKVKLLACILSATFAAFSGLVLGGRLVAGSATLANEFLLPAVAAVVVGGTALTGGVGSVWRTLIGALIVSVVRVGMTFLGVDVFAQQIVLGVVLIAAVWITIDRAKIPIVK